MLKCNINDEKSTIFVAGDIREICVDLTNMLSGIAKELEKRDKDAGLVFKMMFTKGFMEGICFDTDRATMEKYLRSADGAESEHKKKKDEAIGTLKELRDMLADMTDKEIEALERRLPDLEERLRKGNNK